MYNLLFSKILNTIPCYPFYPVSILTVLTYAVDKTEPLHYRDAVIYLKNTMHHPHLMTEL